MRPSVRLGQIAGIAIGLHWSIVLIAGLLTLSLSGTILPRYASGYAGTAYLIVSLVTAVAFLASIVAHEMGHSLVALRNDIKVKGVTLFALGGVARLDGEPTSPGAAARIALAGPAVSVGLGAVSLGAAIGASSLGISRLAVVALVWLGVINLSLAVFNMLPALPLDGGRVLQSYLWHRRGDRHGATIAAAGVGRWIGWAVVLLGLWELSRGANSGLWTIFIGWFVVMSARGEAAHARVERLRQQGPVAGPFSVPFPFGGPTPTGPPTGTWSPPSAGSWPPPRAGDRFGGTVIEVDGRPVDSPPVDSRR